MDDPQKKWEEQFKKVYEEGGKFTAGLVESFRALQLKNKALAEKAESLEKENIKLAKNVLFLAERNKKLTLDNDELELKYAEIEKQNANFASLFVSSYQIHSSLDPEKAIQNISDVVTNLIGADYFGVFFYDAKNRLFVLVGGENIELIEKRKLGYGDNLIGRVCASKKLYVAKDQSGKPNEDNPMAVVPFWVNDQLVGALAIYRLLPQKSELSPADVEALDLLGGDAATALLAAMLYKSSQRRITALEEILKTSKTRQSTNGGTTPSV